MTDNINWGEVVVPAVWSNGAQTWDIRTMPIALCAIIEDMVVAANHGRDTISVYVQRDLFYKMQIWRGPVTTKYVDGRRVWFVVGRRVRWTKGRDPYYLWGIGGKL